MLLLYLNAHIVSVIMSNSFKLNQWKNILFLSLVINIQSVNAAEWKSEPSLFSRFQYNDNVNMRADNNDPQGSTGFTLEPRLRFAGEELKLWDLSIDARGKVTRFQDIEDADSDNAFFVFDGGRKTERSDWRLNTSFERNSNFDTDFDTETPDAGLFDDHTERKTASVTPSVNWKMSETSRINFSLDSTDVRFDEKVSNEFKNFENKEIKLNTIWDLAENQQFGFTGSYSEFDSPEDESTYDQSIFQLDYTYTINKTSRFSLSYGIRKLESAILNVTTACEGNGIEIPINNPILAAVLVDGKCPESVDDNLGGVIPLTPILEDFYGKDDGTVVNLTYKNTTETQSHSFTAGRTVVPSSFGGAQEVRNATYIFNVSNTERLSTDLILDASETETVSGSNTSNDRTRYRFEPTITYRLNRNWNLSFIYRYIDQNLSDSNEDSTSNAVFVNLFLHWPKLVTTY